MQNQQPKAAAAKSPSGGHVPPGVVASKPPGEGYIPLGA